MSCFSDSSLAPRDLATNGDKVIDQRDANPAKKVISRHEDINGNVVGSNLVPAKDFFYQEISFKMHFNILLALEFFILNK